MKDSYTLRKLHLAHDIVAIMFKPDSVADVLSAQMDAAGIGLKPGLGCTTQHEYWCVRSRLCLLAIIASKLHHCIHGKVNTVHAAQNFLFF